MRKRYFFSYDTMVKFHVLSFQKVWIFQNLYWLQYQKSQWNFIMFKFSAASQIWKKYIQKLNDWDLPLRPNTYLVFSLFAFHRSSQVDEAHTNEIKNDIIHCYMCIPYDLLLIGGFHKSKHVYPRNFLETFMRRLVKMGIENISILTDERTSYLKM